MFGVSRRTRSTRPVESPAAPRLALAIADANWYSTANLFGELDRPDVASLLLRCDDYLNAFRRGRRPWTRGLGTLSVGPRTHRRELVLPSGWMKRFPTLGMRPIASAIRDWHVREAPGSRLALVMTYPHYLYLRDRLRPDLLVYYNLDDYTEYWPRHTRRLIELERRAVLEADLTVCVSRLRSERLREAVPEAAEKIRHLPHGTPSDLLGPGPAFEPAAPPADLDAIPGPRLGFVGSLEDRIDWPLLDRLAVARPDCSIVLIGSTRSAGRGAWLEDRRRCLARPNVHPIGFRPQSELGSYLRAFDICLIPYQIDHPFNVACSPTKIADYLGTGRPIVATALPECRSHDDLFEVAEDTEEFLQAINRTLVHVERTQSERRYRFAVANSCRRVAHRLVDWLDEAGRTRDGSVAVQVSTGRSVRGPHSFHDPS